MNFGGFYEQGDLIIGEYEFIQPMKNMESISGYKLKAKEVYTILREIKDHLVVDVLNGEEKVRKYDINRKYELVNHNLRYSRNRRMI